MKQQYPKALYRKEGAELACKVVANEEAHLEAMEEGWSDHPSKLPPASKPNPPQFPTKRPKE